MTTAAGRDSMREFPMATSPNPPAATPQARRWIIVAVVGCSVMILALAAFFGVGRWLVVEDPVEKARAIAVLSGRMPVRAVEAAKLYRRGYAPEVWLTQIHEGVPAGAIHVLEPPIVNTADEIRVISGALDREKDRSVILVTSKPHTRRVRLLWRKLAPVECRAIVRAASEDPFDPRHWWRNSSDALDVVREVLGLMNAWAGLPLTRTR